MKPLEINRYWIDELEELPKPQEISLDSVVTATIEKQLVKEKLANARSIMETFMDMQFKPASSLSYFSNSYGQKQYFYTREEVLNIPPARKVRRCLECGTIECLYIEFGAPFRWEAIYD